LDRSDLESYASTYQTELLKQLRAATASGDYSHLMTLSRAQHFAGVFFNRNVDMKDPELDHAVAAAAAAEKIGQRKQQALSRMESAARSQDMTSLAEHLQGAREEGCPVDQLSKYEAKLKELQGEVEASRGRLKAAADAASRTGGSGAVASLKEAIKQAEKEGLAKHDNAGLLEAYYALTVARSRL